MSPWKRPNFGNRCRLLRACHSRFNVTRKMAACPFQAYIA